MISYPVLLIGGVLLMLAVGVVLEYFAPTYYDNEETQDNE